MILENEQEQKALLSYCDLALRNFGIKGYPIVDFLMRNSKLKVEEPPKEELPKEETKGAI